MSEKVECLKEAIETLELRILNDKYGDTTLSKLSKDYDITNLSNIKDELKGLLEGDDSQLDSSLLYLVGLCKEQHEDENTLQKEKEFMQELEKEQQVFPAITITETAGSVSVKLEFNTMEDYFEYNSYTKQEEDKEVIEKFFSNQTPYANLFDCQQKPSVKGTTAETMAQVFLDNMLQNSGEIGCCNCEGCFEGEDEPEIQLSFTLEELLTINQVLGFVAGDEDVNSVLSKIENYIDYEQLEDSFQYVMLESEIGHSIPMQSNELTLKIV